MKKALIFFTDSIVFGVFIGLVALTFIVTNSLSPVLLDDNTHKASSLDNQIDKNINYIQVSDNLDNLIGDFRFEDNFKPNQNISFTSSLQDGAYLVNLDINNLKDKEKIDLVKIINPTDLQYNIKIEVLAPLDDIKNVTTNLIVNDNSLEISKGVLRYTMKSDERTIDNIALELTPDMPINYSFKILVKLTII